MNEKESLLSKIRKLMAKAESTEHEAEAEAFLAKAQQLIVANAIEDGELREADRSAIITRKLWVPQPYSNSKCRIAGALAKNVGFFCHMSGRIERGEDGDKGRWLTMYGTEDTLSIAETVFTSLLMQCGSRAMRLSGRSPGDTKSMRDRFIAGFAHGVSEQLRSVNNESTSGSAALVLMSEYNRAQAACSTRLSSPGRKHGSQEGYNAGLRANVNRSSIGTRRAIGSGR